MTIFTWFVVLDNNRFDKAVFPFGELGMLVLDWFDGLSDTSIGSCLTYGCDRDFEWLSEWTAVCDDGFSWFSEKEWGLSCGGPSFVLVSDVSISDDPEM